MNIREKLKDKKRIVIKIGSSSLMHPETGRLDLIKLEILVRELADLKNQGKDVVLVSSGAIMVGRNTLGFQERPQKTSEKQACASVGQAKLDDDLSETVFRVQPGVQSDPDYQKYNGRQSEPEKCPEYLQGTALFIGVIPVVNENDTIATYEIEFGDNDTLSAVVAALINADLLILLSDIDGLYTDDPHTNPDARFISQVDHLDGHFMNMGKGSTGSSVGNRGHGHQTQRCPCGYRSRRGYDYCQRKGFSCDPQDYVRAALWNSVPGRPQR